MELTGKSYDAVTVALYDCDNDTNKAVNFLLEQNDQVRNKIHKFNTMKRNWHFLCL